MCSYPANFVPQLCVNESERGCAIEQAFIAGLSRGCTGIYGAGSLTGVGKAVASSPGAAAGATARR